ncbi:MAG: hypothetical protein ACYTJ0_05950 [Planctomycetota bacterium]|jgi:hypothetical protein
MSQPIAVSVCLLAMSGTLATCEDDQAAARREAAQQIEAASDSFQRAARIPALPGGEAFAERRTKLEGVLRDAKAVPDAEDGPRGSKGILIASVQRELAAMELAETGVLEQRVDDDRRLAHSLLDAGHRLAALAEARRSMEVSDALTRLENQREAAGELRSRATTVIGEVDGPIEEMTAQNEAEAAEVERLHEEANRLRREAAELGPALGFSRFEQAVNLEREADRYEYAIARREIDLDYELRPERRLAERQAELAATMLESVGRSERTLGEFLTAMERDADATEQTVAQLGAAIAQQLDELEAAAAGGEESLTATYDRAIARLEEAARQASGAIRHLEGNAAQAARLAEARAHAQLGRVLWSKAGSLSRHRTLLQRLAADDGIVDGADARQRLEAVEQSLEQTMQQTVEAYTSAQTSLGQVNFRGRDVGDANLALGAFKSAVDEALAALNAGSTGGESLPITLEGATGSAPPASGGTPAGAAPQVSGRGLMSPQALLQRLQQLGNDKEGIQSFLALCATTKPDAQAMLTASSEMASALEQLQDAFEAQYGSRMSGMAGQAAGSTTLVPTLTDATLETDGDTTVCRFTNPMGQPDEMMFRRVDGRWYIDADDLVDTGGAVSVAQVQRMSRAMQQAAQELAPRIRRGELGTAQAAEQAIAQGIMQAMMGAMGGAPGN